MTKPTDTDKLIKKDFKFLSNSKNSGDELFGELLGKRQFKINFEIWTKDDEEKFVNIYQSVSQESKNFFDKVVKLGSSTPIKNKGKD